MHFVKGLANYKKCWHMLLTSNHICSNNLPLWQSVTKTTTNKWTYERFHKSLNPYTLVEYSNIYYPNTNIWKTLQEESLWQEDFESLYFWNTLIKTHQSILVWNRNNRLHTINKKHVYKERKKTTHVKIGERTVITTSNVYISTSTRFAITIGSQDLRYMNNVSKK